MSLQQRRLLIQSFLEAQFGYCSLVWMFHGRELNSKINRIHERSLRIVLKGYNSSFNGLLKMNKSVCIHHINIQSLAIELFKVKGNLSNTITSDAFPNKTLNYDLRSQTVFFFSEIPSIPQNLI